MKYFALFGTVLFGLFALVQINDPDPYIWIPVYLFAAGCSFSVYRQVYPVYVLAVGAILYLGFSVSTFPADLWSWVQDEFNNGSMSMKTPSMEEARESLGSLICFFFLSLYIMHYFLFSRKRVLA